MAALLTMRGTSQQSMLDDFFAALSGAPGFVRGVSDRAFAQARRRLHMPALAWLNEQLVERGQALGWVPRWHGLRGVAGDASVLRPAMRACHRTRGLATPDQRLFALYLPAAELTLHASVHGAAVSERAMLAEALQCLGPDDLLVLDRGYPAAWLAALLDQRGQRFVMRCDSDSGFAAVRAFMRSADAERVVQLPAPSARDAADWGCRAEPTTVRLVRHIAPGGQIRVLMTNVGADTADAPAFADLYHQRWRIEEAFKRLKHRMRLESVSGLSQHALLIDVAAKILADNLASLMCAAAAARAVWPSRRCNRAYAASLTAMPTPRGRITPTRDRVSRRPLVVSLSCKSMLENAVGRPAAERVAAAVLAAELGADVVRVNDVAETVDALKVRECVRRAGVDSPCP